ncbi:MAG: hypothetical protein H6742_19825 [Alphaproteobacteria bacterium]|nr:hypothetical protein [Alphaproteobacteria bacterium]
MTAARFARFARVDQAVTRVHEGVLAWTRSVLQDAGIGDVDVRDAFSLAGDTEPHVVVHPLRVASGLVEERQGRPVQLLGTVHAPDRTVPRGDSPVALLARVMSEVTIALYAGAGGGAPGHAPAGPRALRPLAELPEPLRAWLEAQDGPGWVVDGPKPGRFGSLPSLLWRPGIASSVHYLLAGAAAADTRGGTAATTGLLSALSVVATAARLDGTLSVDLPAPWAQPALLAGYLGVLARSLEEDPAARSRLPAELGPDVPSLLREAAGVVVTPHPPHEVSLEPTQDLGDDERVRLMQVLGRPLMGAPGFQVGIHVAEQIEFQPAATVHP